MMVSDYFKPDFFNIEYICSLPRASLRSELDGRWLFGGRLGKAKVPSTPAEFAAELAQFPTRRRILFETGEWPRCSSTA